MFKHVIFSVLLLFWVIGIILFFMLYLMKKILWTTIFWLIVFFGFALYMKMFDANMAAGVSTWLGATTITTSGETISTSTGAQSDVMSGIITIQTTLSDMQLKLDTLVG
jgi:hypothetical protein